MNCVLECRPVDSLEKSLRDIVYFPWQMTSLDVQFQSRDDNPMICPRHCTIHHLGIRYILHVSLSDDGIVNVMRVHRSWVHHCDVSSGLSIYRTGDQQEMSDAGTKDPQSIAGTLTDDVAGTLTDDVAVKLAGAVSTNCSFRFGGVLQLWH